MTSMKKEALRKTITKVQFNRTIHENERPQNEYNRGPGDRTNIKKPRRHSKRWTFSLHLSRNLRYSDFSICLAVEENSTTLTCKTVQIVTSNTEMRIEADVTCPRKSLIKNPPVRGRKLAHVLRVFWASSNLRFNWGLSSSARGISDISVCNSLIFKWKGDLSPNWTSIAVWMSVTCL